ncbi:MAG: hypothetical protein AAF985_09480 [Bacteroidota bacterium]
MKPGTLSLLVCLLLVACKKEESQKTVASQAPQKTSSSLWSVQPMEAKEYLAALRPKTPSSIESICEESKGYRNNEWPGLNECDWAIEQQLLDHDQAIAQREGPSLALKLMDGNWMRLKHSSSVFYQYKGWLKDTNHFLVLINQSQHCNICWMINRQDGSKQRIEGVPYFSEDGQQAIVTSQADDSSKRCNGQLELWQFRDGQFRQVSIHPTPDRINQKVFWSNNKAVWLRQSSGQTVPYQEHYAKIEWQ